MAEEARWDRADRLPHTGLRRAGRPRSVLGPRLSRVVRTSRRRCRRLHPLPCGRWSHGSFRDRGAHGKRDVTYQGGCPRGGCRLCRRDRAAARAPSRRPDSHAQMRRTSAEVEAIAIAPVTQVSLGRAPAAKPAGSRAAGVPSGRQAARTGFAAPPPAHATISNAQLERRVQKTSSSVQTSTR